MNQPTFKDPWPKDPQDPRWKYLAYDLEQFQEAEVRQINLERDRKALLDTIDHLIEANDEAWLVEQVTELYFRLVRK
jgi:hypothetical protein